jgi:hypothetical protein
MLLSEKTFRKAFRLCVKDEDRDRLLDPGKWPDSVAVCEWIFHEKQEGDGKRLRLNDSGVNPVATIRLCPTSSADNQRVTSQSAAITTPSNNVSTSALASATNIVDLDQSDPDRTEIMDTTVIESNISN